MKALPGIEDVVSLLSFRATSPNVDFISHWLFSIGNFILKSHVQESFAESRSFKVAVGVAEKDASKQVLKSDVASYQLNGG